MLTLPLVLRTAEFQILVQFLAAALGDGDGARTHELEQAARRLELLIKFADLRGKPFLGNDGIRGVDLDNFAVVQTDGFRYAAVVDQLGRRNFEKGRFHDEYILVYDKSDSFLAEDSSIKTITLSNGITLNQKSTTTELEFAGLTNAGYAVVVPDDAINGLGIYQYFMAIDTKEDTSAELEKKLVEALRSDLCEVDEEGHEFCSTYRINIRGTTLEESNVMSAIVTAICVYMSFIFSAIVGTILAIQTLSDSTKYNYRYTVLKRLGVKDEKLYKTIRKQLYVLFGVPAIYPIIISFVIVYLLNRVYKAILPSPTFYLSCFGVSILIFIMIYVIYFIATYFGFKRNIDKS